MARFLVLLTPARNAIFLAAVFCLSASHTPGAATHQTPVGDPAFSSSSTNSYVIEELLTQHQVQEDGSGQKTIRAKVLVKDHAAVSEWSTLVFPYLAITERFSLSRLEIEKPDGRRVTASSLTAEDVVVPGQLDGPILSDLRGKRIVVPALQPGDRLTYEAVVTRSESLVPGHFWIDHEFTRNAVVMSEAFEIDVPSARSFNIRVRRGTEEPERPAASGRRIRRWIHQQAVPQTPQAGASVLEALLEEAKNGPDIRVSSRPGVRHVSFHIQGRGTHAQARASPPHACQRSPARPGGLSTRNRSKSFPSTGGHIGIWAGCTPS